MSAPGGSVPVIDVGGTHVTAARADTGSWRVVPGTPHRAPLDSRGSASEIIAAIAAAIRPLGDIRSSVLGVAMPGPFDYASGTGRFRDVEKFDALNGVDVGVALRSALPAPPVRVSFVNDAAAFTIGEWVSGAAQGAERVVGITLGTGVGSGFLDGGRVVSGGPDVPPGGFAHLLRVNGRPLEDLVSRRAIIAAYQAAAVSRPAVNADMAPDVAANRDEGIDVDVIARLAADGDGTARSVISRAMDVLGGALLPWLARFRAQVLVVGGGIAGSWELVGPALGRSLSRDAGPAGLAWHGTIVPARYPEESSLVGAAWDAVGRTHDGRPMVAGQHP